MKHIFKYISVLAISAALTSCSEGFLDIPQQGVQSAEVVYKNADDNTLTSFITPAYVEFYHTGVCMINYTYKAAATLTDMLAGESLNGAKHGDSPLGWNPFLDFSVTSENPMIQSWWSAYYKTMYMCNLIIANVPENNVASEAAKTRIISEARVLRSIVMMYLVQFWGNPPLADHVLNGTEGNTPAEESWKFIINDIKEAAEGLPSKNGLGSQEAIGGRLTKEAAYAYLGKAYLWTKDYNNAALYLDKVISSGKYQLSADFNDMNELAGDFCDENLWEFNLDSSNAYISGQTGGFIDIWFTSWNSAFLRKPDQFVPETGFGYGSTLSPEFVEFMKAHDTKDGVKDARFNGTLISFDDILDESRFTYNFTGKPGLSSPHDDCVGYFQMKYAVKSNNLVEGHTSVMNLQQGKNTVFMRYAEVLLNYAEAVAMGGKQGNMSGLDALNQVRNRAGLDNAPALDMNNAEYGVKAERRAELFADNARFIDLVRWGDAESVLKDTGKYRYNFHGYEDGNNIVKQDESKWVIEKIQTDGKGWQSKYVAFPYPYIDITSNNALEQNQGW